VNAHIYSGMNLRDALDAALRLGVPVEHLRGTGEVMVGIGADRVRVNRRRKDAPRSMLAIIRRYVRKAG